VRRMLDSLAFGVIAVVVLVGLDWTFWVWVGIQLGPPVSTKATLVTGTVFFALASLPWFPLTVLPSAFAGLMVWTVGLLLPVETLGWVGIGCLLLGIPTFWAIVESL